MKVVGKSYESDVMAGPWTDREVAATVRNYFDMLRQELQGQSFNKTEHRRKLAPRLSNRSEGAIEKKHQNISAVLIELGFPYIDGYKPLFNYQHLLRDVVAEVLQNDEELAEMAMEHALEPATPPQVNDILGLMKPAPTPIPKILDHVHDYRAVPTKRNYMELESRNRSLGEAGEQFVVEYEYTRLRELGRTRLAKKVERVSETQGDGIGFDVLSFETNGREKFIEVKTTAYGPYTPFFVTENELAVSRKQSERYHLYRAYNFRRKPEMFRKQGALDSGFALDPSQYRAYISS